MIKIIEENESVLLGVCPNCLSKFTVEDEDLIYLHIHSDIIGCHCPVCSDEVTTCDIQKVSVKEVEEIESGK